MLAAWLAALAAIIGDWFGFTAFRTLLIQSFQFISRSKLKTIIYSFIGTLFAEAVKAGVEEGLDSEFIRNALIKEIFNHTGIELETLDADGAKKAVIKFLTNKTGLELETIDVEGAKKAAGKFIAEKVNQQYGTDFEAFYPLESIVDQIKHQIELEVVEALQ